MRDPAQDQVVSEAIVSGAGWDAETVHTLARALNLHPGAVFIGDTLHWHCNGLVMTQLCAADVGSNLGAYTVPVVAGTEARVVAVDM